MHIPLTLNLVLLVSTVSTVLYGMTCQPPDGQNIPAYETRIQTAKMF